MSRTCLGKITGVHGVKGLVKIQPFGEDPALIETLGPVFTSETGSETLQIALKSQKGKEWLASIRGVSERSEAEKWVKTELWVDKARLPALEDENSFYIEDLIGLPVQDENGADIGKVVSVQNFGASDLLEIEPAAGKSFYVPLTDDYIPEIGDVILIKNYEDFI